MKIKNTISFGLLLACFLIQTACDRRDCGCAPPPPSFKFILTDKNEQPLITKYNRDSLNIMYKDALDVPQSLSDIRTTNTDTIFNYFNQVIYSYDILSKSIDLKDPIFDVQLSKKTIGKIQLKTSVTSIQSDGKWIDVSEVMFNGKKVDISNTNGAYILKVE